MIEEKQKIYQSAKDMSPELATAVLQWVLAVADSKHRIGLQFSHWVTGTPALEGAVGAAAITQDELGHARSLYGLLRDFPGAPEGVGAENDLQARDVYYAPDALTARWESWFQVIAINILLDSALQMAISQTIGSSYHPLAGRTAKILQEEQFHRIFGESWLKRLVKEKPALRESLQQKLDWAWQIADQWLGPESDPVSGLLVEEGVLGANTAVMRQQWLEQVTPILTEHNFDIPANTSDWSNWNPQFRQCNHA